MASSSSSSAPAAEAAAAARADGATSSPAPKADSEVVSTVSTSASSDDEHGTAGNISGSGNFKFNATAAEFVPGDAPQQEFKLNPNAIEFNPVTSPMAKATPMQHRLPVSPSGAGSPFLAQLPVSVPRVPGVPVAMTAPMVGYAPVVAIRTPGGFRPPYNVIGFPATANPSANFSAFHDSSNTPPQIEREPGMKGKFHSRAKGRPQGSQAHATAKSSAPSKPEESAPAVIADADMPPLRSVSAKDDADSKAKTEKDASEVKEKKKTWADIARESMSKAKPKEKEQKAEQDQKDSKDPKQSEQKGQMAQKEEAVEEKQPSSQQQQQAKAKAAEKPEKEGLVPVAEPKVAVWGPAAAKAKAEEAATTKGDKLELSAATVVQGEVDGPDEVKSSTSEAETDPTAREPADEESPKLPDAAADRTAVDEDEDVKMDESSEAAKNSWADRVRATPVARAPTLAPKAGATTKPRGPPPKPVGIPQNPTRAPWAKAAAASPPKASEESVAEVAEGAEGKTIEEPDKADDPKTAEAEAAKVASKAKEATDAQPALKTEETKAEAQVQDVRADSKPEEVQMEDVAEEPKDEAVSNAWGMLTAATSAAAGWFSGNNSKKHVEAKSKISEAKQEVKRETAPPPPSPEDFLVGPVAAAKPKEVAWGPKAKFVDAKAKEDTKPRSGAAPPASIPAKAEPRASPVTTVASEAQGSGKTAATFEAGTAKQSTQIEKSATAPGAPEYSTSQESENTPGSPADSDVPIWSEIAKRPTGPPAKQSKGPVPSVAKPREVAWGPGSAAKVSETKAMAPSSPKIVAQQPVHKGRSATSATQKASEKKAEVEDAWDAEPEDPPSRHPKEDKNDDFGGDAWDVQPEDAWDTPTLGDNSCEEPKLFQRPVKESALDILPGEVSPTKTSRVALPIKEQDLKIEEDAEKTLTVAKSEVEAAPEEQKESKQTATAEAKEEGTPSVFHRYEVSVLLKLRDAAGSRGACPESIPSCLRAEDGGETAVRKRYTIEFLRQFKDKSACKQLPVQHGIPDDLRKEYETPKERRKGGDSNRHADSWRSQDGRSGKKGDSRKHGSDSKEITREPMPKLETSENSWAAQQKKKDLAEDEAIIRKMKAILNKLTIDKFDMLVTQLFECGIDSKDHVECLMKEVFEKATTQHHFISMYTDLCMRLNDWFTEQGLTKEDGKDFKRVLLNQCQESFEKYLKPPEGMDGLVGEELYEAQVKYKTKMLGNMRFVGQLLINKMLSSRIIFQCIEELLYYHTEETLETLCVFLTTIGPAFDTPHWKNHHRFLAAVGQVKNLIDSPSTNGKKPLAPRIRCLLKDVVDLQEQGWAHKATANKAEGPTTLKDVERQWKKDQASQDRQAHQAPRRQVSDNSAMDEWQTVRKGAGTATAPPVIPLSRSTTAPTSAALSKSDSGFSLVSKDRKAQTPKGKDETPSWRSSQDDKFFRGSASATGSPGAAEHHDASSSQSDILGIVSELQCSHDVDDAVWRVKEMKLPRRLQPQEFRRLLNAIVEKKESVRHMLFQFAVVLVRDKVFDRSVLIDSMDLFFQENYDDLKIDIPKLPKILEAELLPLLAAQDVSSIVSHEDIDHIRRQL